MFELKVANNKGEVLNLTTSKNYTVFKIEGLSLPALSINSSGNVNTDGTMINSAKINNRNLVIYMTIEGDIEENRLKLYKYFPAKKNITIFFKNDNRDVYIEGMVELIECNLFSSRQVAQISIICPQPYFVSVDELVNTFSKISPLFSFPFSIPVEGVEISAITPQIRKSIINTGDIDIGCIIDIYATGTVINPTIFDAQTGTHMAFNLTLYSGDRLIINTNSGKKSITLIRDGVNINAIGYMSPDSEWFVLETGDNVFTYDADEGLIYMQIFIKTSLLYGGV